MPVAADDHQEEGDTPPATEAKKSKQSKMKKGKAKTKNKSQSGSNVKMDENNGCEMDVDHSDNGVNFEATNNFVDLSGSISKSFLSELENEQREAERCRLTVTLRSKRSRSHRATVSHDHDSQNSEHMTEVNTTKAQLNESRNTLDVMYKYLLKKGLINASMSKDEVMKIMTTDNDQEEFESTEEDESDTEIQYKSSSNKGNQSQKDKFEKQKKQKKSGKEVFDSPSEVTVYRNAVRFRGQDNHRKSDSSDGVVDVGDEVLDQEDSGSSQLNCLQFVADPRSFTTRSRSQEECTSSLYLVLSRFSSSRSDTRSR